MRLRVLSVLLVFLGIAGTASAQSNQGLAGLLLRFFSPDNPVVLAPNLANPAQSHDAHFVSQSNAQLTLRQINAGVADGTIANAPIEEVDLVFAGGIIKF